MHTQHLELGFKIRFAPVLNLNPCIFGLKQSEFRNSYICSTRWRRLDSQWLKNIYNEWFSLWFSYRCRYNKPRGKLYILYQNWKTSLFIFAKRTVILRFIHGKCHQIMGITNVLKIRNTQISDKTRIIPTVRLD